MGNQFEIQSAKRIYFASDLHLGAPHAKASAEREKIFGEWLDAIAADAQALYLVGDLFDFWFEYRHAVPKGFVRTLGKLAALHDRGVKLYFFTGNHDLWVRDYLSEEIGFEIFTKPVVHVWNGKRFYIGHGDGLGPGDAGYKFLKRVFTFRPFQWAFRWLHPDVGIALASMLSKGSRARTGHEDYAMHRIEDEALFQFARTQQKIDPADYWVFGHRHFPITAPLYPEWGTDSPVFCNLGDWIKWNSWASFDGTNWTLHRPDKA